MIVVGGLVALNRLLPNIDLQQMLQDISSKLGAFTYVLVGLAAFIETAAFVGLVLPGETVVLLGGALAGQGETSVVLTIGVVWAAALAGDSVSFLLGRRLGREFLLRHGPKVRITHERFARVEDYFSRHGGKTIVIGRFIGLVRALAPFTAGSSGMRYGYYLPFGVVGTGLWAATFVLIGYFASQSLDAAARAAGQGTLLFGIAVGVIVAIVVAIRFLRRPENRRRLVAGMESRRALRPLLAAGRWVAPPARFVWARVTPGRPLGLEFTTLLAILAVSLYVVIAYTGVVSDDPGPTAGDRTALDIADQPAGIVAHRRGQGRRDARLGGGQSAAGGRGGGGAGRAAALDRGGGAGGGGGDHLPRGRRAEGRRRRARARRIRWPTRRGRRFPAATPPTR